MFLGTFPKLVLQPVQALGNKLRVFTDALARHIVSADHDGPSAYGIATALFAIGLCARFATRGLLPVEGFPFLTFFPAVLLAAFLTSLGPALWCSFLSILAARYFFMSPRGNFFSLSGPDLVALVFFAGVLVVDSVVISAMKHAMRPLKRAEERIQRSDRQKVDFMNLLAHEFRTPLQIISATALMMKRRPESDSGGRAATLDRQARQMSRLVNDLLDSARADLNKLRLDLGTVDLNQLLANVDQSLSPVLAEHRSIRLDTPQKAILVNGDHARLTQVVENLITNASKFSSEGTEIRIVLRASDVAATVSVIDAGKGMTNEQIQNMFELYSQSEEADAAQGGIGLGLSLARQIVELHGGTIKASSAGLGHGTTVEFSLPKIEHPSHEHPPTSV